VTKQKFRVDTREIPERAILVGIDRGDAAWPLEESLAELERLTSTAGATVVHTMSQRLLAPNPRTFIGQGKAEELVDAVRSFDADVVIFDDELSPSQQSNLEKLVGSPVKVIDRTALILDIFALHATSKEGRLQVKLAQNQYLYPRLRGMWSHLAANRMGGGVGSRFGEGESQLEVDRRLVRKRIGRIRAELKDVASSRETQRKHRNETGVFRVALAGYTNAGKSSIMNRLTGSNVLAYDKLFATLDSTTRQLTLEDGHLVTLTDTVGFIQKLPHSLVEAFKSTLDEIKEADLILLVADVAAEQRDAQIGSVREVLGEIGASDIPTVVVYNKIDLMRGERSLELAHLRELHPSAVFVSAAEGTGTEELLTRLGTEIRKQSCPMDVLIPYSEGRLVELAHKACSITSESYTEQGTHIEMYVPQALAPRFERYSKES
jgi:GTP-binding protein HflX